MGLGLQPPELTHILYPIRKTKGKGPESMDSWKANACESLSITDAIRHK